MSSYFIHPGETVRVSQVGGHKHNPGNPTQPLPPVWERILAGNEPPALISKMPRDWQTPGFDMPLLMPGLGRDTPPPPTPPALGVGRGPQQVLLSQRGPFHRRGVKARVGEGGRRGCAVRDGGATHLLTVPWPPTPPGGSGPQALDSHCLCHTCDPTPPPAPPHPHDPAPATCWPQSQLRRLAGRERHGLQNTRARADAGPRLVQDGEGSPPATSTAGDSALYGKGSSGRREMTVGV